MSCVLATQARALAHALDVGAASPDDVVAWADAWLLWDDSLYDGPLLDPALGRRLHVEDLIGVLRRVPGEVDPVAMWGLVFGWMLRALDADSGRGLAFAEALMQWRFWSPPGFEATGFQSLRYDYAWYDRSPDEDGPSEELLANAQAELRAELIAARNKALSLSS